MGPLHQKIDWDMNKSLSRVTSFCEENDIILIFLLEPVVTAQRETGKCVFGADYTVFVHEVAGQVLARAVGFRLQAHLAGAPTGGAQLLQKSWSALKAPERRVTNRILRQIDALVAHNVENLRWAMYQNIRNAFQLFASAVDDRFLQAIVATRGTIEAACLARHDHDHKAGDHVARLESAEARLRNLRGEIRSWATKHE